VSDVPVAELADEERRPQRRSRSRSRRVGALVVVIVLLTAGGVFAARAGNDANGARRKVASAKHPKVKVVDDAKARVNVLAALSNTTSSGSFKIRYILKASPGTTPSTTTLPAASCGPIYGAGGTTMVLPGPANCYASGAAPNNVTISGEGVVHVTPTAMVTTSNVPNLGEITTRVDGTNVWEDGGANYGMAPSAKTGPGSPLSEFAGLVMGTLGRREGAIAMTNMASPTGYLDIAKEGITSTAKVGDAIVDGVPVQEYTVTIDTMHALDRPGLTAEEIKATTAALDVLKSERYSATTVTLSVDGLGFIRRAHTVIGFADGGTVTGDTTFSDFGCSSVVLLANGPSIVSNPTGCRPKAPTPPSTTAPATATTPKPATAPTTAP